MARAVERWEGLAILGPASFGPVRLSTPALAESVTESEPVEGLSIRSAAGTPGVRRFGISDGLSTIDLEFPVPTPEVAAAPVPPVALGEGAWAVHGTDPPSDLRELRARRPDLILLSNARALWADGRPFVRALEHLRTEVGAGPVLWAPRVALPHRIPLLAYLGVDLVDTVEGRIGATRGEVLTSLFGPVDPMALGVDAIRNGAQGAEGIGPVAREQVRTEYRRAIEETRTALRLGRLRELVESRLTAEPAMAEMLRYADHDLETLIEQRAPVAIDGSRNYVLTESHRRPEMRRFRQRLLERYTPPPSKAVLLLVPCSKTKPYRNSRSHRRFYGALEGVPGLERLHLVSVSSPIGLVPRELEDVPPARHYDIPVTGEWSREEQAFVEAALGHLLRAGRYRSAIVHLDPVEYRFLHDRFPPDLPVVWTVPDGRTTARPALEALRSAVTSSLDSVSPIGGGPLAVVREELREVASVQFGRAAADRLFAPPVRLAGRPWFQRLTDGRSDLATVREERGWFHLTVAGARRLAPDFPLAVRVDPSLSLSGDLFTPGVRAADPQVRCGDSVVLVRDGELAGVGEAMLPGPMMTEIPHGLAVRVRHRAHPTTDTPKTEEGPRSQRGPVV